ncbi:MAG: 4Fe-4S dicluster domain-containing protein [Bryobacteraceae bacterium]
MSKALLYDSTLCVGCKTCEGACAERWSLPYNDKIGAEGLSAHKMMTIEAHGERFSRVSCQHCAEPTCVSVCPVGALQKSSLGPVVYEADKCMGCRYCMTACPFQVPSYEWNARLPRVRKCDMCYERQAKGQPTACTASCPTGATICGEREQLVAEARKRIAEKPKEYFPRIYGLREVGGTSVLYLSAVPFEKIGLRTNVPQEPIPALTWRVLSVVPDVVSVGSVLLGGIYWITNRRDEVARKEGKR